MGKGRHGGRCLRRSAGSRGSLGDPQPRERAAKERGRSLGVVRSQAGAWERENWCISSEYRLMHPTCLNYPKISQKRNKLCRFGTVPIDYLATHCRRKRLPLGVQEYLRS